MEMYRNGDAQKMNHSENYYANYDEDGRLSSNHGQVEFLTTMKYIYEIIGCNKKSLTNPFALLKSMGISLWHIV